MLFFTHDILNAPRHGQALKEVAFFSLMIMQFVQLHHHKRAPGRAEDERHNTYAHMPGVTVST
jgi:hypothetical protein